MENGGIRVLPCGTAPVNYMCEAMMNSGPRRVKYRAGLNHAVDDDHVGHCQSHWHSNARVIGLVKSSFDHDLSQSKQSFQQCCWSHDRKTEYSAQNVVAERRNIRALRAKVAAVVLAPKMASGKARSCSQPRVSQCPSQERSHQQRCTSPARPISDAWNALRAHTVVDPRTFQGRLGALGC